MKANTALIRNIIRIFVLLFFVFCVFMERKTVWAGRVVDLVVAIPVIPVLYCIHRIIQRRLRGT